MLHKSKTETRKKYCHIYNEIFTESARNSQKIIQRLHSTERPWIIPTANYKIITLFLQKKPVAYGILHTICSTLRQKEA